MGLVSLLLLVLAAFNPVAASDEEFKTPYGEMNDAIDWMDLKSFKKMDLSKNKKPVLYAITQPWCGACKLLKKSFRKDGDEMVKLSKQFIMVAVNGEENNDLGAEFTKEGKYIPRIMFGNTKGELQADHINPVGVEQYKYFYTNARLVAESMQEFLKKTEGKENL